MKPMVGFHSSPVFLLSLLFCVFFYLSNTSEITLITPRITTPPPPLFFNLSWLSSHILWNFSITVIQSTEVEIIVPGEIHPQGHSRTQCVEFQNPLQWVRRWFAPMQPQHYITTTGSPLHFTVPPELKLHDEWQGNQIDFPMQRDTAALETVLEEELFRSRAKRTSW